MEDKDLKFDDSKPVTTFYEEIWNEKDPKRTKAILEYFEGYIIPKETGIYARDTKAYINHFSGSVRSEEEIFQDPHLKKFDAYTLYSIKQAVEAGKIDKKDWGNFEYLVDVVDNIESQMERYDAKGKKPSDKKMISIIGKARNDAVLKRIRQDTIPNMAREKNSAQAKEDLTDYVLKIPIGAIEAHKPKSNQSDLRKSQMIALFRAYQDNRTYGNFGKPLTERNNQRNEIMSTVLAGSTRFPYEGQIAVTQDDVSAVALVSLASKQLVKEVKSGRRVEGMSPWDYGITDYQMIEAVNTLIGMANVVREKSGEKDSSFSKIITQETANHVTNGIVSQRANDVENFAQLAENQRMSIMQRAHDLISKTLFKTKEKEDNQK